jgi:hypothetical protein
MLKHTIGVLITLAAFTGLLAVPSFADSQARIVRLSYTEGDVRIDRNAGQGFEKAFLNLPIIQGAKLRAGHDGFAEVEFEDGSTLRITPGTIVAFPQLILRDSGTKVSSVDLLQGTVYVSFAGEKDHDFALTFGAERVTVGTPVHFRLALGHTKAALAVFKGDAQVEGPSGTVAVGKKQSVTIDLAASDQYTLAKNVAENPYDSWDQQQSQYYQRYVKNNVASASAGLPYSYGATDLSYFGAFTPVPGYGMMWQPFFVGAGWDPFMDGAWAFYPGFGYSWASAYPWGWMPYHYGSWGFVPGYGWGWQPGGAWTGLNNLPQPIHPPAGFVAPAPPALPGRGLVVVNRGGFSTAVISAGRVMIRNNSAGLGINRGSIGNLGRVSHQVAQRGFANATLNAAPSAAAAAAYGVSANGFGSGSGVAWSRSTPSMGTAARGSLSAAPAGGMGGVSGAGSHK